MRERMMDSIYQRQERVKDIVSRTAMISAILGKPLNKQSLVALANHGLLIANQSHAILEDIAEYPTRTVEELKTIHGKEAS